MRTCPNGGRRTRQAWLRPAAAHPPQPTAPDGNEPPTINRPGSNAPPTINRPGSNAPPTTNRARGRQGLTGLRDDAPSGRLATQTTSGPPSARLAALRGIKPGRMAPAASRPGARGTHATSPGPGRGAHMQQARARRAHTTRPGPAAPNSAEDPGLVKQSDQTVHHEGGECFERGLDLALGQRCERCDSVVGPGAREFARLIEHVVGAQAFHDRGEGLVGG